MSEYCSQNLKSSSFKADNSWVVLSPIEKRIKEKIEAIGKPLKDWDISIYRGILTGYNEAFIIDGATKDALIAKSAKNAEIIRPILRGRDIKRYRANFADLWLIYIPWHFPLHDDSTIKGASEIAEQEFQKQYPDIYNHLLRHKKQLSNRNLAETGIRYEWYALQRFGSNYTDDFSKQKIIYPEITKFLNFYYDEKSYYVNNKCFILTGGHLCFLTAFFNSKLFRACFKDNFPELLGGTRELRKVFIEEIPVLEIDDNIEIMASGLIKKLSSDSEQDTDRQFIMQEIDNLIYELYCLTEEEISFIENL